MTAFRTTAAAAALALCAAAPASAAMLISIDDVGSDLSITYAGTLDLSGYTAVETFGVSNFRALRSNQAAIFNLSGSYQRYQFAFSLTPFGTDPEIFAAAGAGDSFYILPGYISVPLGYVSGTFLAGEVQFANTSIAALGMSAGTQEAVLPNDSITIAIGQGGGLSADVPVPAAAPLLLGALGLGGFIARRKG
ncbi:hypothetical protein ACQ5SO_06190 [Rhodovulum sp. DZ06]|uniref:hypothetical protein n=1 Tax=Rhodovulum sp. DZ06 TaxID=3425126 RepID=UPI003D3563BB